MATRTRARRRSIAILVRRRWHRLQRSAPLRLIVDTFTGIVSAALYAFLVWLAHGFARGVITFPPSRAELLLGAVYAPIHWLLRLTGGHREGLVLLSAPPELPESAFAPRRPVRWSAWLARYALLLYLVLLPWFGVLDFLAHRLPQARAPTLILFLALLLGLPIAVALSPHRLNRLLFRFEFLGVAFATFLGGNVVEAVWLGRQAARSGNTFLLGLLLSASLAWLGFWFYGTGLLHLWSDRPWEAPRAGDPSGRPAVSSRTPRPEQPSR